MREARPRQVWVDGDAARLKTHEPASWARATTDCDGECRAARPLAPRFRHRGEDRPLLETVPSDAKGLPCRAGYGLCSGASSSSRSQPSSGQPATRRMSHPPFRQAQRLSLPRRFRRHRLLLRRSPSPRRLPPLLRRKPRPRLRPHLRPQPRRRPQPRPLPLRPRHPLPLRRRRTASRVADCSRAVPETPSAPPVVAQEPPPPPAPAPLAEAPLPSPAPGRETQEVQGEYAPKSLAQLVGAWAYSAEDCNRLFERRGGGWAYRQPLDKFAQAAIVEPKRILLPSATCRVERASEAEGALKVSAECADSITYTPRSVMITLRSATELLYSASGDPLLATALKKCPP